jgi:hypothetical protein
VAFARDAVPNSADVRDIEAFIEALPRLATRELLRLGLPEIAPLEHADLALWEAYAEAHFAVDRPKTFCIGLSRTGTKSLTAALGILGQVIAHHPSDDRTYREITSGRYDLTILGRNRADGVSDLLPATFFAELDAAHPGSRFIHTIREKEAWLDAMEAHWADKSIYEDDDHGLEPKVRMRRFLRAACYGTYTFSRERLGRVHDDHHARVHEHFAARPGDLLELDILGGDGWQQLCPFLGEPVLDAPFPRVEAKRSLGASVLAS